MTSLSVARHRGHLTNRTTTPITRPATTPQASLSPRADSVFWPQVAGRVYVGSHVASGLAAAEAHTAACGYGVTVGPVAVTHVPPITAAGATLQVAVVTRTAAWLQQR